MTTRRRHFLTAFIVAAAAGAWAEEADVPTLTIRAADFRIKPVGCMESNGWNLCVNGEIRHAVTFAQTGTYNVVVVARGESAAGQWPRMAVSLDDQPIFQTEVADADWMPYAFLATASSGAHEITVGFINDHCDEQKNDRNLHLSTVTLAALTGTAVMVSTTDEDYHRLQTNRLAQWEALLDGRIASNRQGNLVIWTVGDNNEPLTNVAVSVRQLRHEFRFGTALCSAMFASNAPPEAEPYLAYAARAFNAAVTENALKWTALEPEENQPDYALSDRMAAWCASNRIALRGHCLFWGCEVPEWAQALSATNLWDAMDRRTWKVINRYSDTMEDFDILNEPVHCSYFAERLGEPGLRAMFNWARDAAPRAGRYINEYGILEGYETERYVETIRALKDAGAGVNGIGVQAHFDGPAHPRHIDRALDQLAVFRLPIKITELDCSAADENVRVQCISNVMKTAFAHPAVEGIMLWGFWENCHWRPASALLKADFSRTALADLYESMVFSNWWTQTAGFSDSVGRFALPAFFGDYEIEALSPEGRYTNLTTHLTRSERSAVVTLHFGAAPSKGAKKRNPPEL